MSDFSNNKNKKELSMSDFTDHVIIYAKGWYGKSDKGIIHDLTVLLSMYSNIPEESISQRDITELVINTFARTCSHRPYDIRDALVEILIPSYWGRDPLCALLGKVSIWKPDNTFPFSFEDLNNKKNMLPVYFNSVSS